VDAFRDGTETRLFLSSLAAELSATGDATGVTDAT